MKRVICFCLLVGLFFAGCTTINLPNYIPDKNPYKRRYHASYEDVVFATRKALKDMGYLISLEPDPGIYERTWEIRDPGVQHVLMMTNYDTSSYGVSSANEVLNAYLRSLDENTTDVELRYMKVSTISFKTFYDYRNDKLIEDIYKEIEENLNN